MASAEWFFSTMAQTVSALLGFLITLVLVIHELDQREKRTRTEELRNYLLDIQKKYDGVLYTVMEAINQPFNDSISVSVEPDRISINEIIDDISFENIPTATKIWLLSYKIDNIISEIEPAEAPKEDRLLGENEIQQLIKASEYILEKTEGNESELITEINEKGQFEDIGVSEAVFEMDDIDHPDLDQWFDDVLREGDRRRSLDGQDILSISNLFNEFDEDMRKAKRLANNTLLSDTTILSRTKVPILVILLSGVFLPLSALISPPFEFLEIDGSDLVFYESSLLIISFLAFFWLLYRIKDEV